MNPVAVAAHIEAKPRQMDDRALWVLGRLQDSGGIPSAARSKGAPKGYMPSAKSIQNWLGEATDQRLRLSNISRKPMLIIGTDRGQRLRGLLLQSAEL